MGMGREGSAMSSWQLLGKEQWQRRTEHGGQRAGRRPQRPKLAVAVLVLSGLLAGMIGATPAPAEAETSRPVLIVGATAMPAVMLDWITFLDDDYDVYRMPLTAWGGPWWGNVAGTASMARSARDVKAKVGEILGETGAARVDVIAISQGAPVVRYYVKNLGGLDEVAGVVSFGGVNYGIPWNPYQPILALGCGTLRVPVCEEIIYRRKPGDTSFLKALNTPDPTPGDIDYYHLYTEADPNTPTEAIPLPGAENLSVQEACPGRLVFHADMWDSAVQELIVAALEREPLTSSCSA